MWMVKCRIASPSKRAPSDIVFWFRTLAFSPYLLSTIQIWGVGFFGGWFGFFMVPLLIPAFKHQSLPIASRLLL